MRGTRPESERGVRNRRHAASIEFVSNVMTRSGNARTGHGVSAFFSIRISGARSRHHHAGIGGPPNLRKNRKPREAKRLIKSPGPCIFRAGMRIRQRLDRDHRRASVRSGTCDALHEQTANSLPVHRFRNRQPGNLLCFGKYHVIRDESHKLITLQCYKTDCFVECGTHLTQALVIPKPCGKELTE